MSLVVNLRNVISPDSEQARRLVQTELARPEYSTTWWDRFRDWVADLLRIESTGGGTLTTILIIGAVLAAAATVVLLLAARQRRRFSPSATATGPVLNDNRRGSADYRRCAAAHLLAGRATPALLDAYRAVTAAGIESGAVPDATDITAYEVAASLLIAHPADSAAISQASRAFDSVRYGGLTPTLDDARIVADLADRLAASDPATPRPGALSAEPVLPR